MKVKPALRTESVSEYYFSAKLRQIDKMRKEGADVINLGIGSPDQPPSENTIARLASEAARPDVHGYQSYIGAPALRKAFSDWYLRYFNVTLDPESEILPLIGSKEGIMHISMAFVDPGDEVLIPNPGYPTYSSVTKLTGGKVRYYDLVESRGWEPDFESLEDEDTEKVKLMWINYPHMPTGTRGSMKMLEKFAGFALRKNILIVNDNPYSFILNNEHNSLLAVTGSGDVALELNSLSKSHNMAGWRIGMLAGNSEYLRSVIKVKSNMDSGMFLPMQLAAAEALGNPGSWYEDVNRKYSARRKLAGSIMDLLSCRYESDQVGLFLWGRLPQQETTCEDFVEEILVNTHVFVTPGFIFGSNGDRYIRISLCATEKRLEEAAERITQYIRQKQS